jgi:hypothetical protein
MAKAKTPMLLDDVIEKATITQFWIEAIPKDFLEELREVRTSFLAGQIPARRYTIANVIIKNGKSRGIRMPSEKAVAEWLQRESD